MRKSNKKIGIVLFVILILISGFCFATDGALLDAPNTSPENQVSNSETTAAMINDDVYEFSQQINVPKNVNGNAFLSGDTVTLDKQIAGNAFIIGNKVIITNNAYIAGSAFIFANEITVDGIVFDLYSYSSKLIISEDAGVYRDLRASAGTVDLQGQVGKNAFIIANDFTLNKEAGLRVYGDLNYTSKTELEIPNGIVSGKINFTVLKEYAPTTQEKISAYATNLVQALLFTLVVFAIAVWLMPKSLENLKNTVNAKFLPSIGIGLAGIFIIPIVILILMYTTFTIPIAVAILTIFILLLCISFAVASIAFAQKLAEKFHLSKNYMLLLLVLIVTLVLWLLKQIPAVGGYITFFIAVCGFGLILTTLLNRERTFPKKEEKVIETKKEKNDDNSAE